MNRKRSIMMASVILSGIVVSGCLGFAPAGEGPIIHQHAEAGNAEAVQAELQAGANVNQKDGDGRSVLYIASLGGKNDVVRVLLDAGANPNLPAGRKGNDTPLHAAAKYGHWKTVEILVENGATVDIRNKARQTPLHYAAWNGRLLTVKTLLKAGASSQAVDYWGNGCLYYNHGIWHQRFTSETNDLMATTTVLIAAGVPVNAAATSPKGYTPLMSACANAPADVVKLLLLTGADPSAKLVNGATALSIAEVKNRSDVISILKAHAAGGSVHK